MEIRKINLILFASLLAIFLTACGGGGSGGNTSGDGGNGGDDGIPPEFIKASSSDVFRLPAVTGYQSSVVNPEYDGDVDQAEITRYNTIMLMEAFYQVTEPAVRITSALLNSDIPDIYKYDVDNSADTCSSGTVTTDSYYYEDPSRDLITYIMLVLTYDACIIGGTETNGQLIIRTRPTLDGRIYNFEAWFEKYQIKAGPENLTLHGYFTGSSGSTEIENLTVNFADRGVSYHTEEFIASDYNISGTFYHSLYGYVDVQDYTNGGITLTGVNDTLVHATMTYDLELDQIQFSLIPADGLQYDNLVPVWAVFDYAYSSNSVPVALIDDHQVVREEAITIDAGASFDGNFDFLSYSWDVISVPENCSTEVNLVEGLTTQFSSPCRGEHQLRLNVFDGYQTSSSEFIVDVLAAPPEIANTEFNISAEEDLNFSLSVLNTEIDGPFIFRKTGGVEGINISENGVISGTPVSFAQNGRYLVHVEIANDHTRDFEIAIDIKSDAINWVAYNADTPGDLGSGDWADIDLDGNPDRLVAYYNNFAIIEFANNSTDYDYIELRELSPTGIISMSALDVMENEGSEIILGYHDRVIILSGTNYSILKTIEFPENLEINERDVGYVFIDGANPGVVVVKSITSVSSDNLFYGFTTDVETPLILDNLSLLNPVGQLDVNNDGIKELVLINKVFYLDGSYIDLPKYISHIEDLNADGQAELIHLNTLDLSQKELTIEIINPLTAEVDSSHVVSLDSDITSFSPYDSIKTRIKNIDSDPEPELLLIGMQLFDRQIDVYENNNGVFSYDQSYSIDEENLWYAFDSLAALTVDSVGLFLNFDFGALTILSKDTGMQRSQTEFAKYYTHSDDKGGLFKYRELPDGAVSYLCNSQKSEYNTESYGWPACRLTLDAFGKLEEYHYYQNVIFPSSLNYIVEIQNADSSSALATFGFGDEITLYDLENDQEIDSFVHESYRLFRSGDLNQDGQDELYALRSSDLQRINLENNTSETILSDLGGRRILRNTLITDFAGLASPRLLTLVGEDFGITNGYQLYLYSLEYVDGELTPSYQTLIVPGGNTQRIIDGTPRYNLALQDTNDDGVPELLVTSSRMRTPKLTDIWIFDDKLNLLSSFSVAEDLYLVPNLEHYAKSNILGVIDDTSYPGAGYFDRHFHSRFVEVDSEQHRPIWYSTVFPGEMMPNTFTCRGGDIHSCGKSAVFDSGVLFFQ